MSKYLGCALLGCVISTAASAQSSMTLYGIIDTSIAYVSNQAGSNGQSGGHIFRMESGAVDGSRWGLKGVEDLGGGTQTVFQIENGFNSNDGTRGQGSSYMFGRQAYVGLQNTSLGTVTLGRQYDPIVDLIATNMPYDHAGDVDNTDNSFRVNNAVKYVSPNLGGLVFEGMYAFGGVAGSFGQQSTISGGASYTNGPLNLSAAYFYARNPARQFPDGNFASSNTVDPTEGPFGFIGLPSGQQIIGATAAYTIGHGQVAFAYTNVQFYDAAGTTSTVRFNNYELTGSYQVTPAVKVAGGYTYSPAHIGYLTANNTPSYSQVDLYTKYQFSKRTDVYLKMRYQFTSGGVPAHLDGNTSSTSHELITWLGIEHQF